MKSAPLHVLHVIESLGQGGAERNLLAILRSLQKPSIVHHLAWLDADDTLRDEFAPLCESLHALQGLRAANFLTQSLRLRELIRERTPNIVHTQLTRAVLTTRLAMVDQAASRRVVSLQSALYEEDSLTDFGNSWAKLEAVRMLDKMSIREGERFIAVSKHVANVSMRRLGIARDRISVIPNGIQPDRWQEISPSERHTLRVSLGISPQTRFFLGVGRLVPSKSYDISIAAVARLIARGEDVALLIAGGGPLRERLEATIQLHHAGNRIRLIGLRSDIHALFQAADAFLFPTALEGLPVAMIEALANGCRTIASNIPPNLEVGTELNDITFFDRTSEHALDEALRLELRQPARRASPATVEKIRSQFNANHLAERYHDLFRACTEPVSRIGIE